MTGPGPSPRQLRVRVGVSTAPEGGWEAAGKGNLSVWWRDRQPSSEAQSGSSTRGYIQAGAWGRESREQQLGVVPGGRSSGGSRPEAKSAAIVLMSWRKWWELVKGGSRALEFEKGSKVNLLLPAKAGGGMGRGWGRVLSTLPSGTLDKLPWTREGEGLG